MMAELRREEFFNRGGTVKYVVLNGYGGLKFVIGFEDNYEFAESERVFIAIKESTDLPTAEKAFDDLVEWLKR